ncbi:MAG TPA: hypothetical protein VML55_07140 [Planctomycetaceae bacterium]|nr:hypothetical protein [Planctomycetaceae bacterium]
MVNVGVIGLGPQWEMGYRAALERSRSRIAIRAVYDAVEGRAAQVAAVWRADPCDGIRALLDRPDVRAVLLLDAAWHGPRPFEFILASRKPALFGVWPEVSPSRIGELAGYARDQSLTLIPAFPQRYMPSTARLRELIATRIGRPRRITIDADCPDGAETGRPGEDIGCRPLLHLFDWCRQVIRTPPASALAAAGESSRGASPVTGRIELEFRAPRDGTSCRVEIELGSRSPGPALPDEPGHADWIPRRIEIEAERGSATITGPCTICWSASGPSAEESLTAERSEFEVLLDLFCRRVVGGLIPVADFGDIARGLALWSACEESVRRGGPVKLSGRDV